MKRPSTRFRLSRAWPLYVSITTMPVSDWGMRRSSKHAQRYRYVNRDNSSRNRRSDLPPKLASSALTMYATHPYENATGVIARPASCAMARCNSSGPSSIKTRTRCPPGSVTGWPWLGKPPARSHCQTGVPWMGLHDAPATTPFRSTKARSSKVRSERWVFRRFEPQSEEDGREDYE
jgi:hypothetical protein